ncbi:rhamnulose-1-phosphate aldolase/alcohol dehydrogenase [Candidatus Magnetoovum chiemensis]|nr:rhamnulose-1-phosphate aldolase/alcohol dehydrogenase [Candidatus Magnetoovum chiemensis]
MPKVVTPSIKALFKSRSAPATISDALGENIIIIDYITPGFKLAKAVDKAYKSKPDALCIVLMNHGLITWADKAKESYDLTISLVSIAEELIKTKAKKEIFILPIEQTNLAKERYIKIAPILRGLLSHKINTEDSKHTRVILNPLINDSALNFVNSKDTKQLALSPPVTTDYLIRTKAYPLWIDKIDDTDDVSIRETLSAHINEYSNNYIAYAKRNLKNVDTVSINSMARVILIPQIGAICCAHDSADAKIVNDITAQNIAVKSDISMLGAFKSITEEEIFEMEYRSYQQAKIIASKDKLLSRHTAVISGAAGAIGTGIAYELLKEGCHVALTDLPGSKLDSLYKELNSEFKDKVFSTAMDVTNAVSINNAFNAVIETWGGIDIVIINAGIAMVSPLEAIDIKEFRKIEEVNIEGTLLMLSSAGKHFKRQGIGGDIVIISTKNVFSPGASFGAYSATKAASHQLGRIASLEMAGYDVRVNMVSPDAVFSHGERKSGLWETVGPDRMKARGLDEKGLEDYYRDRNLLKTKVTAKDVGKAVLFFVTRQTPTTGATIPVDGGLPDATPR